MRRILVVANRTLCEQHLIDELRFRRQQGSVIFELVVPASRPSGTWTDTQCEQEARERLDQMLETLAAAGLGAAGEVGDADPVVAVGDVLRTRSFDEIIVSTLPVGLSRWLAANVVRRIRSHTGLPVTHVVAERQPADV